MKFFHVSLISNPARECPRLVVAPEALEFIEATASADSGKETGGILVGFHEGKDIRVLKASDAGPNAKRSACGFLRDTQHCQTCLDREHAASGADYVGEWHTHVIDLPRPSEGDMVTLAGIILDQDYAFPSFSMILAVHCSGSVGIQAYMVTIDNDERKPTNYRDGGLRVRIEQVTLDLDGRAPGDQILC